jgi:hypothetical protein
MVEQISKLKMYKPHGYGQYKMKGNVINVPTNIIPTHLPYHEATCVSLK